MLLRIAHNAHIAHIAHIALLLVVTALGVLGLGACGVEGSPQLIQVLEFAPREAEVGDRLEIVGAGFPQGRPAHLLFRGTLHRPGERPVTGVEIGVDGTVTSAQLIELAFTDALQGSFCGGGDKAAHTTFEGEIEVAFSAATESAPPIAGLLKKISIDFRPPISRKSVVLARHEDGSRALAFMGVRVSETPPAAGGLLVAKIEPGSRADDAGLLAGDVIVEVEGVRVGSNADVVPQPGAHTLALALRRGEDVREQRKKVEIEGFRPAPPADLLGAAIVLAAASALVLLFCGPSFGLGGGMRTGVERRIATRMRRGGFFAWARELVSPADPHEHPLLRWAPHLIFAGVSGSFVVMPFGHYLMRVELDVGLLFILSLTSLVTIGILTGGWPRAGTGEAPGYSPLRGLRAAAQIVSYQLPAAIAIVALVMMTGSMRVQEIIRAQGGYPWDWYLFRSPVTFVLFALYFTTTLAEARRLPFALLTEAEGEAEAVRGHARRTASTASTASTRETLFFFAEWANIFVMCGLAAVLFLGGWQLPGISPVQEESRLTMQLLGTGLFLVKAWTLILGVVWFRWCLPRVRIEELVVMAWKYFVPLAGAGMLATIGWIAWSPGRAVELILGVSMCACLVLVAGYVVVRVRYAARAPQATAQLNPFL